MRMEKKAKVMAALALLLPRRNPLGDECCHWLARKQKPTNQMPVHRTGGVAREKRGRGNLAQEGCGWGLAGWPLPPSPPESTPLEKLGCPLREPRAVGHVLCFDQLKLDLKTQLLCCTGHT